MDKNVKKYIQQTGIEKDPLALNMTREQIPSALLMKDSQKFIDEIAVIATSGKRICIIGDYDTDGVNSTSSLYRFLLLAIKILNEKLENPNPAKVMYYIPHRFEDGYGITPKVIDKVLLRNPKTDVLITCDNGIVAFEAAEYAKQKGLKLLITDHHLPLDNGKLPEADVIVNPNRLDDDYPFKGISGTVVVYKLFCEFAKQYCPEHLDQFLSFVDFAGISVISDVMNVTYENRVYLKETLDIFNGKSKYPLRFAWVAMIESLRRSKKLEADHVFTEKDFGFLFSPMLNAQSRVFGDASAGVETFLSTSTAEVREKAEFLISVNEKRKQISNESFARANETDHTGKSVIVIRDDLLGDGFIGLVAGKITEKYNRPSVVFTEGHDGVLKGSARCPEGFNLIENLEVIRDLTIKMGGHSGAAGLSIPTGNLDEFTERLTKQFDKVIPKDFSNKIVPDLVMKPGDVNIDFLRDLNQYAPFGAGFPYPVVEVENLLVDQVKEMGKANKGELKPHLKYLTKEGIDIVVWNAPDDLPREVEPGTSFSAAGTPEVNNFLGQVSIQMVCSPNNVEFQH